MAQRIEKDFPNRNITYSWMTFPWLVSLYLDCMDNNQFGLICPSEEAKDRFLDGVSKGYIWFNAFPFNSQLEMYDKLMLSFGIQLSYDIMNKTNVPSTWKSHVLSQRDVPSMPRSVLPVLKKNGIRAISVGSNSGSVPYLNNTKIFRWKDIESDTELLYMYHHNGYGGNTLYDALIIPDFNHALIYSWNSDNLGPYDEPEVVGVYETIFEEFEIYDDGKDKVKVFASTFDNFLDALYAANNSQQIINSIPVVTESIGDTWSYGIQQDVYKTAAHRAAQRLRAKCLREGNCTLQSPYFYNFSRLLLKNGEHTFGGSVKKYLDQFEKAPDYTTYYNEPFFAALASNDGKNNFTAMRESWYEQRDYGLNFAVDALSRSTYDADLKLYQEIMREWEGRLHNVSAPNVNDENEWVLIKNKTDIFKVCNGRYNVGFNQSNGAIAILVDTINNVQYTELDNDHQFGQFWYQTLNNSNKGTAGHIELPHYYLPSQLLNIYQNKMNDNNFLVEMNMGNEEIYDILLSNYSAVMELYNNILFDCDENVIEMNLDLINKTITRVTEGLFFSFNPLNCNNWKISSIEQDIALNDVTMNGTMNVYSYGINGNISCIMNNGNGKKLNFKSPDVGLASFKPIKYPFSWIENEYSYQEGFYVNSSENDGFAFYLMNNLWSTNYPQWYPFAPEDINITYNFKIFL